MSDTKVQTFTIELADGQTQEIAIEDNSRPAARRLVTESYPGAVILEHFAVLVDGGQGASTVIAAGTDLDDAHQRLLRDYPGITILTEGTNS